MKLAYVTYIHSSTSEKMKTIFYSFVCTLYLRVGGMTIIDRKEETNGKQSDIRKL